MDGHSTGLADLLRTFLLPDSREPTGDPDGFHFDAETRSACFSPVLRRDWPMSWQVQKIKVRTTTLDQTGEAVQVFVVNLIVPRRNT